MGKDRGLAGVHCWSRSHLPRHAQDTHRHTASVSRHTHAQDTHTHTLSPRPSWCSWRGDEAVPRVLHILRRCTRHGGHRVVGGDHGEGDAQREWAMRMLCHACMHVVLTPHHVPAGWPGPPTPRDRAKGARHTQCVVSAASACACRAGLHHTIHTTCDHLKGISPPYDPCMSPIRSIRRTPYAIRCPSYGVWCNPGAEPDTHTRVCSACGRAQRATASALMPRSR
jgi:hypothetical protein